MSVLMPGTCEYDRRGFADVIKGLKWGDHPRLSRCGPYTWILICESDLIEIWESCAAGLEDGESGRKQREGGSLKSWKGLGTRFSPRDSRSAALPTSWLYPNKNHSAFQNSVINGNKIVLSQAPHLSPQIPQSCWKSTLLFLYNTITEKETAKLCLIRDYIIILIEHMHKFQAVGYKKFIVRT